MKRQWLGLVFITAVGFHSNLSADVQNIRITGDIRTRGYYFFQASDGNVSWQDDSAFIEQRTRVSLEADLDDHVLAVVTLAADGLWGAANQTSTAGPGTEDGTIGGINRGWTVGFDEAYVQLNEIFYSPVTLMLGRQYLNYGRGLIISSYDEGYNFDAARAILDYYPLTVDLVGARSVDNGTFGGDSNHQTTQMVWLDARYQMTDSAIKNIEAYFGWIVQSSNYGTSSTNVPPSVNGASPKLAGGRADLTPGDSLKIWLEGAYEFGPDGSVNGNDSIGAFIANAGFDLTLKDVTWTPVLHANYIGASGGGSKGDANFLPWFDYQEGQNGYVFCPNLSNIHIFNLGATIKPYKNTTFSVQGYYYLKFDANSRAGSNENIDYGGLEFARETPQSNSRELGWEIDATLGYDYSRDVRLQLIYGCFIPGGAYTQTIFASAAASEVRGEIYLKF
jgi:hypothetical protein